MDPKFFNLDKEKQQRIIRSALKEFANKGYEDASTIEIAKEAGISKGLLFHYFNTKKELFLFLFEYTVDIVKTEFYNQIKIEERDFFRRIRQIFVLKQEVYLRHPFIFDFVKVMTFSQPEEFQEEMEERKDMIISVGYERLFANLDMSMFREDIDSNKARDLIVWSLEGYGNRVVNQVKDMELSQINLEEIYAEFDEYLEVMKKGFYRSEVIAEQGLR